MREARLGLWRFSVGLALAASALPFAPAEAGPGSYDPKTGEFSINYTYARLPGVGQVGEPIKPSDQVDANVRSFIAEVSKVFEVVTDNRGKLATPQLVDSVARADIVISTEDDSDRAAWATPKGFGGQGNVYIYYKYLADPSRRDGVSLTVVHELCHYIFDMPDEYSDPDDGAPDRHCPPDPTGQGCLMDNYWSRTWYHKLCKDDHNTTIASRRQGRAFPDSCQSKVDAFFAQRGVIGPPSADNGVAATAPGGQSTQAEATRVQSIVQGVISKVKMNLNKVGIGFGELRDFAKDLVTKGLKDQNLNRTEGEVGKAVDLVMKAASFAAMDPPAKFMKIASFIKAEAVKIANKSTAKDDASKIAEVQAAITKLAVDKAPPDAGTGFAPADLDFLESVARSTVLSPPADDGKPKDKTDVLFQYNRYLFEAIRDLSADSAPAVAQVMTNRLKALDEDARALGLAIPIRPRFGTRRTMLIAPDPDPRDETLDLVPLQSGVYSYKAMRDIYLKQFAKLIQRNSIQFNKIDLRQRIESGVDDQFGVGGLGGKTEVHNPGTGPDGGPRPSPQANLGELLAAILDDIRKDQLENVAVLIPPGGLPDSLNDFLKTFRNEELVRKSDIRLDVVVVGAQPIPSLLMDLVERSGGVVLMISDIDETGSIAQRLKNDQSAGAWIAVPRQFELPCGAKAAAALERRLGGDDNEDVFDLKTDSLAQASKLLAPSYQVRWNPSLITPGGMVAKDEKPARLISMGNMASGLYFRIYDEAGKIIQDVDEAQIVSLAGSPESASGGAKREQIERLKKDLKDDKNNYLGGKQVDASDSLKKGAILADVAQVLAGPTDQDQLDRFQGLVDRFSGKIRDIEDTLKRMDLAAAASGDKTRSPQMVHASTSIKGIREGFMGESSKDGVVPRMKKLIPIVDRIRVEFGRIPQAGNLAAEDDGSGDSPAIKMMRLRESGGRVLKDIDAAKRVLIGIDRQLRPQLLKELNDLKAALAAMNPGKDPLSDAGKLQAQVDPLLVAANDLYNSLYSAVRVVERGVTSILQPIASRTDLINFQKQVRNLDPADQLNLANIQAPRMERLYRMPFFGEADAEYEIIIGLSHVPPFKIPSEQAKFETKELVEVELRNEDGGLSAYHDSLRLDPTTSTPTMRVYRMPKVAGRGPQQFQLRIVPNTKYAGSLLEDTVRYTVSIASLRPNIQLNAGIVYEETAVPEAAQAKKLVQADADRVKPLTSIRGTFSSLLPGPVVEVAVYGGTPILGANVKGLYQVIGKANELTKFPTIDFRDDGVTPDRTKDDGIYTAQIPLDATPDGGADYPLRIQAFATDKQPISNVAFEPSDDASAKRTEDNAKANKKADDGAPQGAAKPLRFQRATSVHFRVEK